MTDRKEIPTIEQEVQHLRAKCARYKIELDLARCLLENDSYDPTATDMEYWGPLHDKVRELQSRVQDYESLLDKFLQKQIITQGKRA